MLVTTQIDDTLWFFGTKSTSVHNFFCSVWITGKVALLALRLEPQPFCLSEITIMTSLVAKSEMCFYCITAFKIGFNTHLKTRSLSFSGVPPNSPKILVNKIKPCHTFHFEGWPFLWYGLIVGHLLEFWGVVKGLTGTNPTNYSPNSLQTQVNDPQSSSQQV
jgi:hypothetical protein